MKLRRNIIPLVLTSLIAAVNVDAASEHAPVAGMASALADRKAPDFLDSYWYLTAVGPTVSGNIRDSYLHLKADGTVDVIIQGVRGGTFKKWSLSADGKSILIVYDAAKAAAQGSRGGEERPEEFQIQGGGSTLKSSLYVYRRQRKGPKEKKA